MAGDPADIRNWQRRPDGITTSGKLEAGDPARLAAILALAYLVAAYVPRDWGFLTSAWVRPFAAMGRHSLPVFCFGILLSFFARLLLEHGDGWSMQATVNIFCFTALLAVAWMADWSRETVRPRATSPATLPASMPVGNS